MAITVSGLKQVNTHSLLELAGKFSGAKSMFQSGETVFARDVVAAIDAGVAWTGEGQPDASNVARINDGAMAIGALRMEAAENAVLGLHGALSTAQSKVQTIWYEAEARTKDGTTFRVHEDGDVELIWNQQHDGYREALERTIDMTSELRGALAFAGAADVQAKGLVDLVAASWPAFSSTADQAALNANATEYQNAISDLVLSRDLRDLWETVEPIPIPEDPNWLQRHSEEITELLLTGVSLFGGPVGWGARAASLWQRLSGRGVRNSKVPPPVRQPNVPKEPDGPRPVPDWARDTYQAYKDQNYTRLPGVEGRRPYKNDPTKAYPDGSGKLGETLPPKTQDGKNIEYREFDVNLHRPGVDRGEQRIVVGFVKDPNGRVTFGNPPQRYTEVSSWYTNDHYRTFVPIK